MALGVNARTAFSLLFSTILDEFGWDRGVAARLLFRVPCLGGGHPVRRAANGFAGSEHHRRAWGPRDGRGLDPGVFRP